ncbi:GTP cyclohydrolase II [Inquilinus sp. CAU 1745]|uniref:GTP cyclohydrolase II n=1 Tax=Inquilinus sp. CAU 1745 TaxID=3140369 RepID=UPI00325BBB54
MSYLPLVDHGGVNGDSGSLAVDRAMTDLRRGRAILVEDGETGMLAAAIETAAEPLLRRMAALAGMAPSLAITADRAAALGLGIGNMLIRPPRTIDIGWMRRVGYGAPADLPETVAPEAAPPAAEAALDLAKQAHLLPALAVAPIDAERRAMADALRETGDLLSVKARDALARPAQEARALARVGEASVPLGDCEQARFIVFRAADGVTEHVAILVGEPDGGPPLARLHSACLTGDLFGSLRCDCGEQLRLAIRSIAAGGWGVLLYLAQEGRGIGLANKMRAYHLQDTGLDTIDADRMLGFGADERRYGVAVAMLRQLGIDRVRLMTNNPGKLSALADSGIAIVERVPLLGAINPHNRRYLTAKAERAGHVLDEAPGF